MITIEKLNAFGANTAEGLGRCFGNEALYLKLVATIPGEVNCLLALTNSINKAIF